MFYDKNYLHPNILFDGNIDGQLHTRIYCKRHYFNFPNNKYQFASSNLPSALSYMLIFYFSVGSQNMDFINKDVTYAVLCRRTTKIETR